MLNYGGKKKNYLIDDKIYKPALKTLPLHFVHSRLLLEYLHYVFALSRFNMRKLITSLCIRYSALSNTYSLITRGFATAKHIFVLWLVLVSVFFVVCSANDHAVSTVVEFSYRKKKYFQCRASIIDVFGVL